MIKICENCDKEFKPLMKYGKRYAEKKRFCSKRCARLIKISQGDKFGRLTVIKEENPKIAPNGDKVRKILCICRCGNVGTYNLHNLRRGLTKSCGCLLREAVTTHGKSNTTEYKSWDTMIQRCTNPEATGYKYWGGRGIAVCRYWRKFQNFYKDMGNKPKGMTLDRVDNNGNYEPRNCRWATWKMQNNNKQL